MLTKGLDVMKYIKLSAGRASLNVIFEKKNQPRHDGNNIYLPLITAHTTEAELDQMMASTDHEVTHDKFSDFGILKEKKIDAQTSPLGLIWNLLEDSRCNALEAKEFDGFRQLWDTTNPLLIKEIIEKTKGSTKPLDIIINALIKWETKVSSPLFPIGELIGSQAVTDPKLDAILAEFSPRLLEAQNELRKLEGTKLSYELARDIFKALGGDPDEEERKAKEKKEGDPESGEGTPSKKGKEDEEGEVSGGEDKSDEDWCIKKVTLSDVEKAPLPKHDVLSDTPMSKVGLQYKVDFESGGWTMSNPEDFIILDYVNNTNTAPEKLRLLAPVASSKFRENFRNRVEGKAVTSENFTQQVRRLIQIRARVQYQYGVKKGKLDQPRLSRLALGLPGFSERVFKNKISNTVLDAAVTVLIDMSGSMGGEKVLFATEAAVLLSEVFEVLQIPCEILGFSDRGRHPLMFVYKSYSKNRLSKEELLASIGHSSNYMTGNPDGDAILWSYNRIVGRRERRKLLVVMSDGQPAASKGEHGCAQFTKKVVEEIEKLQKVEIYGLGICDAAVNSFYKHRSVVENPEEIPMKLIELIERKLLNDH